MNKEKQVIRFRLYVWAVTYCLLCALPVRALEVRGFTFSHLGKEEGLANQRIFAISQTPSGALWWASMTGVGRYNGSTVRNYRLDESTPYSHLGGRVIKMVTDSSNIYAFDNRGTIYLFDALHDRFNVVTSVSKKMGHDVGLNDIHVDGNCLYLAMHDGVFVMKDSVLSPVMKGPYVNSIVTMGDRLLFCARDGVYDGNGHQLLPYNAECGYYDELSGRLWVGGYEKGLHIVTINQEAQVTADEFVGLSGGSARQNPIRGICPYDDETMLVGIDGEGVFQVRRDGRGPCSLLFDANDSDHGVLHGNGVYSIVVDTWKNIVIGTYSGGIDIARPTGSTAAVYRYVRHNRQSLLNDHVNTVMPLSDELVLMGTDNGISIVNIKTGLWQHCCQGTVVLGTGNKPGGSVLVSTYGKGVYEIDSRASVSHVYTTGNSALTDDHVYATLYDKDSGLWVGTLSGDLLYKPNPRAQSSTTRYYPIHNVQAITQLASGQIAVGTAFGLKLITPGSDVVKELNYAPSGVTDINPFVNHLLASGLELWIATDGGGVYVYHLAKHESRQLTTAHGLPSNYVRSLVKGRDGRIWIATDEGLAFVSPDASTKVVNVNYCYGLNREYSRGAAQNLPNGDIIFGSTTGAIVMHPDNVQSVNYTAKLTIVGVTSPVDQDRLQTAAVQQALEEGELRLSYHQRTFELLFESVNMRNHFDIAYRYRMGHGEWSPATDLQYIRFVDVEPGTHQFILQCISRTSGTVLDTKTLVIVIARPWWNSWWMWCVYVALVILAFYGAWRVYELHEKYMRLTIDTLAPLSLASSSSPHPPKAITPSPSPITQTPDSQQSAAKEFVDKATHLILDRLSDTDFTIDELCREMAMSRTLFYVKLKSYTGKSPQDFVRIIRLERAAALLRSGRSVTDAAALTGFDNPKYFSTVFKKYFAVSPSKYQ